MKRNAIIRIVLWSIVLVVLLTIFFILIYVPGANPFMREDTPAETWIPVPLTTAPQAEPIAHGVTPGQVVIYRSPSTESQQVAVLEKGTTVAIMLQEVISGEQWEYIASPYEGWILGSQMISASVEGNLDTIYGTVTSTVVNVRANHSSDSAIIGCLYSGDPVVIGRIHNNSGIEWGFLTAPLEGWIRMEYVQIVEEPASEETFSTVAKNHVSQVVSQDIDVYASPNTNGTKVSTIQAGTDVTISRKENVNGEEWAYITKPEAGWILTEHVFTVEQFDESTTATPPQDVPTDNSTLIAELDPAGVKEIEIQWAAGNIRIEPTDTNKILIRENAVENAKHTIFWEQDGDELSVKFSKEDTIKLFGINDNSVSGKDLTIYVPKDWLCNSLDIDAAMATITINNLIIKEVEIDSASGECIFGDCILDSLDLDTASGDVHFTGELKELDCDAASANINALLFNVPQRISVDTLSGNLDITLPDGAGFTLKMDALSKDFVSDFETTQKNGSFITGNGRCQINVDAMSGDVRIRKSAK